MRAGLGALERKYVGGGIPRCTRSSRPSLLGSRATPPYRYIATLETTDPDRLGQDMAGEEMQRLLSELHGLAEVIQIIAGEFA